MNVIYFETNYKNALIYILTHIKVKKNRMLFNWIIIAFLISNSEDE